MTKKIFAQPEMMVVGINKQDIIVTSPGYEEKVAGDKGGDGTGYGYAPGQRGARGGNLHRPLDSHGAAPFCKLRKN